MTPSIHRALDEAMLRSYAQERCVDYGCRPEDAALLRQRVEQGESWPAVAVELGAAHEAQPLPQYLAAAACFRVAQAALEDAHDQRLQVYRRQHAAFAAGVRGTPGVQRLERVWHGRRHGAWLFPVAGARGCAVIWGGADGWGEAFHPMVPAFHAQGLAACLLELPGQGLARLQERSFLRLDFPALVSDFLDAVREALGATTRFGVVGNSLGGSLALSAAARDERIAACVTNGGSVRLERGLAAFPRVLQRFGRMLGDAVPADEALRFIETLDLPQAARTMRASLLCVHGGRDALVQDEEARELVELRPGAQLLRWPDGVHCVYNFAKERNAAMARWLASELSNKGLP